MFYTLENVRKSKIIFLKAALRYFSKLQERSFGGGHSYKVFQLQVFNGFVKKGLAKTF